MKAENFMQSGAKFISQLQVIMQVKNESDSYFPHWECPWFTQEEFKRVGCSQFIVFSKGRKILEGISELNNWSFAISIL